MKPFNLEQALAGKKVVTRDGRDVTQLIHFNSKETMPVYAVVDMKVESFTLSGNWDPIARDCSRDLFMAPETKEVWVNAYRSYGNASGIFTTNCFRTKEEAEGNIADTDRYLGAHKITVTL